MKEADIRHHMSSPSHLSITRSYLKIPRSKISIVRIYIVQFSHSLSSLETIPRTTSLCNTPLGSFQKVSGRSYLFDTRLGVIIEKKTLVLDIDETLVYATTNRNDLRHIDETIFIKMTKFGASVKAYLSYRPFLFQFLDILKQHFELILYTCGTASYA